MSVIFDVQSLTVVFCRYPTYESMLDALANVYAFRVAMCHMMALLGLLGLFDFNIATTSIPVLRALGRPRQVSGSLVHDPIDQGFFILVA